ncbi:MAG TPA: DUF4296 domain-containing protein [Chitinophagaceae bacterium]|nr:DUF4296 domain-containing protein [Chitinophagaceae bacterium]
MRTGLLIICCSLIIAGCKNKNRIPANIIPQKKMQAVLWDMMRADQFLADFVLNKDSSLDKRTESIKLYTRVFAIHHISKEQYERSFSFYKTHPALFKVIMDSLSTAKTEAPTEMIKQPVLPDSLQASPGKMHRVDSIKSLRRKKDVL